MALEVILVAENASAKFGGESILPLHYFRRLLARDIPVKLIVHERVRTELESILPNEVSQIEFVDDTGSQKLLDKVGSYLPSRVAEYTTQWAISVITSLRQRAAIRALVRNGFGTVIHQPIPVSPKLPSFMFNLGLPVIIGPLNGGMEFPLAFQQYEGWTSRLVMRVGRASASVANALIPGKRHASLLICANDRTLRSLPAGAASNRKMLVENGVDISLWGSTTTSIPEVPHFVFIGRLVSWKAVHVLIHAMKRAKDAGCTATLSIVGDGPERKRLEKLSKDLNLSYQISFLGFIPQEQCPSQLVSATALLLPSIFECGGAVVLEAMCSARAVVATNWGGPADYLNEDCGILIDPTSEEAMVEKFSAAIVKLSGDRNFAILLGNNGKSRATSFYDWDRKVDEMIGFYHTVQHSDPTDSKAF